MNISKLEDYDVDRTLSDLLDRYQVLETEKVKHHGNLKSFKKIEEAVETLRDYLGFYKIRSEYEGE